MISAEDKITHLKKLGLNGDFTEICKMYEGKPFNPNDPVYLELLKLSDQICDEFSDLCPLLGMRGHISEKAQQRQSEILDMLFPGHGMIFGGKHGLRAVIGLVDIGGMNYLNRNIDFGRSSLITLGEYVFVANDVTMGQLEPLTKEGCAQLQQIVINPDTWICAGVNIGDGVNIGGKSVITLGSVVEPKSTTDESSIVAGIPAVSKYTIDPNHQRRSSELNPNRSDEEIKEIIKHVRKLGINGDLSHYIQQLNNQSYNALDPVISQLCTLSHNLCWEFNDKHTSDRRKCEILDILFFMHGANLNVESGLFCDILGTVKVGNDVNIDCNVALCGNIEIGDNVRLGHNSLYQAIGHNVHYLGRRLSVDDKGNPLEWNIPTFIKILPGVCIGNYAKISGGNIISNDVDENCIIR